MPDTHKIVQPIVCRALLERGFSMIDTQATTLRRNLKGENETLRQTGYFHSTIAEDLASEVAEIAKLKAKYFHTGALANELTALNSLVKDIRLNIVAPLRRHARGEENVDDDVRKENILQAWEDIQTRASDGHNQIEKLLAEGLYSIGVPHDAAAGQSPSDPHVRVADSESVELVTAARPTVAPRESHQAWFSKMVVMSIDTSQYGSAMRKASEDSPEEEPDKLVFELNASIEKDIVRRVVDLRSSLGDIRRINTGDGALVFMPNVREAIKFACRYQIDALASHAMPSEFGDPREYRIGIASGPVWFQERGHDTAEITKYRTGGKVIADAVRIEAASAKHEIWIDEDALTEDRITQGVLECLVEKNIVISTRDSVHGKEHENLQLPIVRITIPDETSSGEFESEWSRAESELGG